jgi:hypothetical protein
LGREMAREAIQKYYEYFEKKSIKLLNLMK